LLEIKKPKKDVKQNIFQKNAKFETLRGKRSKKETRNNDFEKSKSRRC
jgi:hypothetical protein